MNIDANVQKALQYKEEIRLAINNKGVLVSEGLPLSNYAGAISEITPKLQSVQITPNATGTERYPDIGYEGFSSVLVSGDANLIPENVRQGVPIFGVEGTLSSSSGVPDVQSFPAAFFGTYTSSDWSSFDNAYTDFQGVYYAINGNSATIGSTALSPYDGGFGGGYWIGVNNGTLIIPAKVFIEGVSYPVIADRGFECFSSKPIKTLIINEGYLSSLSDFFAYNCSQLTSVILPSNITGISPSAFVGCNALTSIFINKSSESISGQPWGAPNADVYWLR